MSEAFRVCLYVDTIKAQSLKTFLDTEGLVTCHASTPSALLSCASSSDSVVLIDAAQIPSFDQVDGILSAFRQLAAKPLVLLYRSSDLACIETLMKDPHLVFDPLPWENLHPYLLVRTIFNAARRMSGMQQDVQLRLRPEATHASSHLCQQLMYSIDKVAVFMIDVEGRIKSWNIGAERILAYTQTEVLGRHWSTLHSLNDLNALHLESALASARSQRRFEVESFRLRNDGSSLLVSPLIAPVFDEVQQPQGYTELLRDVTTERRSQERLRLAIDVAQIRSWDWDIASGTVTWIPDERREPETLSQLEFKKKIHPDDIPLIEKAIRSAVATGTNLEVELRLSSSDGVLRWCLVKARVFYDESRNPLRMVGIALDISEKKRVEEELKEAKEAAERANEAKSAFLANMSHEIRTPLNAIMGFAELVQNSKLSPEKQRDFIRTITRNGKLLQQLLDDILDLSKVEASRLEVEHIRCSLPEIVSDVIRLVGKQASDRGIYLRVTSEYGLPETFDSDPNRLKQILINIVGNAVKFTQEGGVHLRISTKSFDRGRPAHIIFSVMDTGPGIEVQQQSRLFTAFSQADASVARTYGGTGLGLILSRRLAQLLGGTVELIYSKPGFGSTFRIAVEAIDALGNWSLMGEREQRELIHTPASLEAGTENEKLLEGISVLIVEDAPDSRALACQILGQHGATIAVAENGLQALRILGEQEFDVVLMDLHMPVLDGFDATSELRSTGYLRPILAVSAAAMKDEKDRAIEVGCNDHLTKPFSMGILLEKIVAYARGHGKPFPRNALPSPCPNRAFF